jgi:AcrR family transcriptional regulator
MFAVDTPVTHRERKKLATRKGIHEAAVELVERNGLAGATVEAISELAGVAPRTFWSYFASKEEAVLNLDPERPERLRQALLARPDDEDALTALQRVLEDDLASRVTDRAHALRVGDVVRREPNLRGAVAAMFDRVEQALISAVGERVGLNPDRDPYPALVVASACTVTRVALWRWTGLPGRPGLQTLLEDAFRQLAAGMSEPLSKSPAVTRGGRR